VTALLAAMSGAVLALWVAFIAAAVLLVFVRGASVVSRGGWRRCR
jgi:hypothetical protein